MFVTKDIGGFMVARPLADTMSISGYSIEVIAEGKSLPLWEESGYTILLRDCELSIDRAITILKNERPDVVVATLGSPINLEDIFSKAANILRIPLVWFPDVWGAERRSSATPDVLLSFDKIEQEIVQSQPRFANTKVAVVGHPLVDQLKSQPDCVAIQEIESLKNSGKTVILIAGQGEYTTDMIDFVCESVKNSNGSFAVIPRFHPKYKDSKPEWIAKWNERLATLPEGIVVNLDPKIKTDHIAMLADITVSSFSTTLTCAALARKIPISVSTPATREAMVKSTGLDYYPPTRVGAAVLVTIGPAVLCTPMLRELLLRQGDFNINAFDANTTMETVSQTLQAFT